MQASGTTAESAIHKRLAGRHARLKEKWANARDDQAGESGSNLEASQVFWKDFDEQRQKILREVDLLMNRSKISASGEDTKLSNEDYTRNVLGKLAQEVKGLHAFVSKKNHILAKYDVKRAITEADALTSRLEQARGVLLPRKKFSFRKRHPAPVPSVAAAAEITEEPNSEPGDEPGAVTPPPDEFTPPPSDEFMLSGKRGETIVIEEGGQAEGRDYFLKDLQGCTVVIRTLLSALKIEGIKDCNLYVGPVAGSVFARRCEDCTVFVMARQLRIHDSMRCRWLVDTRSGPIIEDCEAMAFGQYTISYPNLWRQAASGGLGTEDGPGRDFWHRVKDFKWHRVQQSPNWTIMEEADVKVVLRNCAVASLITAKVTAEEAESDDDEI